jgi:transcription antitermination factor NusG
MAKNRRQCRVTSGRSAARPFVPRFVPRPRVEIDRGLAWYCVHTRARAERRALDDLTKAGFPAYLPTETFSVVQRGRIVEVERAPVTRYLFVGLCARQPDFAGVERALGWVPQDPEHLTFVWHGVLQTLTGAIEPDRGSLIRANDLPVRVGAGALQAFADSCTGSGLQAVAGGRSGFRAGETARIVAGAFSGLSIAISDVLCDERIRGLVDLLGGRVVVEATADQLEAA